MIKLRKSKKNVSEHIRTFLGVLLLFISALAFFSAFYYSDFYILFWFCYLSIPLVGIGILFKKHYLIKSQLYILAFPDLLWTFDFISYLINGHSVFGVIDYFFAPGHILPKIVTLQHLIAVPIMFYALVLFSNKKEESWKISFIQVTIIYLITRIFTLPRDNINCVFELCGNSSFSLGVFYPVIWFGAVFLMIYCSRKIFMKLHKVSRAYFNI